MTLLNWMPLGLGCILLAASCGGDDESGSDGSAGGNAGESASAGTPTGTGGAAGNATGAGGSAGNATGAGGSAGDATGTAGTAGEAAGGGAGAPSTAGAAGAAGAAGSVGGGSGGTSGAGGTGRGGSGGLAFAGAAGAVENPGTGDVTVNPNRIDDVLINPGMGLANFHFGWWCDLPPITFTPEECAPRVHDNWPHNHPDCGTAYFRWNWRELEPEQGQIDFDLIDTAIQSANLLGETLSFRVMTIADDSIGIPDWLQSITAGEELPSEGGTTYWPDYRDPTFQSEHARFATALAVRYDGHPAVDHIDIGSVGCWGEWNTACLTDAGDLIEVFAPANAADEQAIADAYMALIDAYTTAFSETPLVMLGIGEAGGLERDVLVHAIQAGTGWRVDCWGDWGIWGDAWSHQDDLYPDMISEATAVYPAFGDTWRHAPIQLEVCGTMPDWLSLGWTATAPDGEVYRTFQWALEQHASVLNAKWTDIPDEYLDALNDLLRRDGYRFVIDSFNHASEVAPGAELVLASTWSNLGVAPMYVRRTLSYRLRGADQTVAFESDQDTRNWLPGAWSVTDTFTVPDGLASGTYEIEVAILDRAGQDPATDPLPPLQLGIEGRGTDGWYVLSQLTVP
jgi:hypothetical protein